MQKIETTYQNAGKYLLSLIREALQGRQEKSEPDGCSWEQIYALAEYNSVEAISFYGLSRELLPEELYAKWNGKANITLFRQISFDSEREIILSRMSNQKISYLPLKGILMVSYYPKPGMRSMADNDILYGILEKRKDGGVCPAGKDQEEKEKILKDAQKQIMTFMKELGYEAESLKGHHDCYMKAPCFNFEMHHQLMDSDSPMFSYYADIWSRAVPDKDNPYSYSLPDEDEYIYFLAHAFKHFDNYGCGIRCVVDQYVFLKKKGDHMDWKYIGKELDLLSLSEFEHRLKALAFHAFEKGELDGQDEEMLFYMLGCGTYGNIQTGISNVLEKLKEDSHAERKGYKLRYWRERIFLSKEKCKMGYPFFYKHYWLVGLLPIYRLLRGLFYHPGQLLKEFIYVWKYK